MKRLTILFCLVLSGCFSLTPRSYDPVEYNHVVTLTVNATRSVHRCNDQTDNRKEFWGYMQQVNTESFVLDEFINNKSNSDQVAPAIDQVRNMVSAILIRQKFSNAYCTLKLTNIQAGSRIISRVLGQTEMFGACDGGIKKRYDIVADSYKSKAITEEEYKELANDVVNLGKIDAISCSVFRRKQLLDDVQVVEKLAAALPL